MFRYPLDRKKNSIYRQGLGTLFRSVKFLALLTLLLIVPRHVKANKSVLCYEVFKKWPLLSLFPDCIWKKLLYFSLSNNFGTLYSCSGLFPFRHTTLSYYVWTFKNNHYPSEVNFSLIKLSHSPMYTNWYYFLITSKLSEI